MGDVPCNRNLENTNINEYWIMGDSILVQNTTVSIHFCLRHKYYCVCKSMQIIMLNMWPGKATCGSASSNL